MLKKIISMQACMQFILTFINYLHTLPFYSNKTYMYLNFFKTVPEFEPNLKSRTRLHFGCVLKAILLRKRTRHT